MTNQNRVLRYKIAQWEQATECLSNNSRELFISVKEYKAGRQLKGKLISVNHSTFGTLFATLLLAEGTLISQELPSGLPIHYMSTPDILEQLARFGFYIIYEEESSLPSDVVILLMRVRDLGFDKITISTLHTRNRSGSHITRPVVLAFKSEDNFDLMSYGIGLSESKLGEKLRSGTVIDLTHEKVNWEWLTATLTIAQVLEDNSDIEKYGPVRKPCPPLPPIDNEGLTPYTESESEDLPEDQSDDIIDLTQLAADEGDTDE